MKLREVFFFFLEILQIVAIALVIVVPIRYFVFQPFIVLGASMEPNFHDGDYLIVDELSYRLRAPERGEVVVFHYPNDETQRFIKRIIGLPGETIELLGDKITITDTAGNQQVLDESKYLESGIGFATEKIVLSDNQYFVMGDNRAHSFDSRTWGALSEDEIIGRVVVRAWPIAAASFITAPQY